MFEKGQKVRWMGVQVVIAEVSYLNTTKGAIARYNVVSPTGNYITDMQEHELELIVPTE